MKKTILGLLLFLAIIVLLVVGLSWLRMSQGHEVAYAFDAASALGAVFVPFAIVYIETRMERHRGEIENSNARAIEAINSTLAENQATLLENQKTLEETKAALKEVEAAEARISKAVEYLNKHAVTASLDGATLSLHSAGTGHSLMFERK